MPPGARILYFRACRSPCGAPRAPGGIFPQGPGGTRNFSRSVKTVAKQYLIFSRGAGRCPKFFKTAWGDRNRRARGGSGRPRGHGGPRAPKGTRKTLSVGFWEGAGPPKSITQGRAARPSLRAARPSPQTHQRPAKTYQNLANNLPKHLKPNKNLPKSTKTNPKGSRSYQNPAKTYQDMQTPTKKPTKNLPHLTKLKLKPLRTYRNLPKTCRNLPKPTRIFQNLPESYQNLPRTCKNLQKSHQKPFGSH